MRTTLILLFLSTTASAATVTPADLQPAQITETVDAASVAVSSLNSYVAARSTELNAAIAGVNSNVSRLQTALPGFTQTLDSLSRLNTRPELQQLTQALQDRAARVALDGEAVRKNDGSSSFESGVQTLLTDMTAVRSGSKELLEELAGESHTEKIRQAILDFLAIVDSIQPQLREGKEKAGTARTRRDDARKASTVLAKVSSDRDQAARVLAAALSNVNNASTLGQTLNNEFPGSAIIVRDVRDLSGILVTFQIGTLTHCFSPKLQCGGRGYSIVP
jgi:hypothetical protein